MANYEYAKSVYAKYGVDTDKAIETLKNIPVAVHCWQGDDVVGFDSKEALSGGIQTTGNYPGKATTPAELMADFEKAMSLVPGAKKLNLHASYAIFEDGNIVGRDAIEPKHFAKWVEFAKAHGMGLDFNPTFFAHPMVKDNLTLSSPDEETRAYWVRHGQACVKIAEYFATETGIPCVMNIWIPDGYKDIPADRLGPRKRFKKSLDEILSVPYDKTKVYITLESKVFGIGVESYTVGSSEFCMNYVAKIEAMGGNAAAVVCHGNAVDDPVRPCLAPVAPINAAIGPFLTDKKGKGRYHAAILAGHVAYAAAHVIGGILAVGIYTVPLCHISVLPHKNARILINAVNGGHVICRHFSNENHAALAIFPFFEGIIANAACPCQGLQIVGILYGLLVWVIGTPGIGAKGVGIDAALRAACAHFSRCIFDFFFLFFHTLRSFFCIFCKNNAAIPANKRKNEYFCSHTCKMKKGVLYCICCNMTHIHGSSEERNKTWKTTSRAGSEIGFRNFPRGRKRLRQ